MFLGWTSDYDLRYFWPLSVSFVCVSVFPLRLPRSLPWCPRNLSNKNKLSDSVYMYRLKVTSRRRSSHTRTYISSRSTHGRWACLLTAAFLPPSVGFIHLKGFDLCVKEEWTLMNSFFLLLSHLLQVEAAEEDVLLLSSLSWRLVPQRGESKSDLLLFTDTWTPEWDIKHNKGSDNKGWDHIPKEKRRSWLSVLKFKCRVKQPRWQISECFKARISLTNVKLIFSFNVILKNSFWHEIKRNNLSLCFKGGKIHPQRTMNVCKSSVHPAVIKIFQSGPKRWTGSLTLLSTELTAGRPMKNVQNKDVVEFKIPPAI